MEFLTPPLLFNENDLSAPPAYAGILAFHKYWGKKPYEPLAYLIERLTDEGDIILDPFMGSGVSGFAANHLRRRFIGIDLNPVAHKLSSLVLGRVIKLAR
jgi:DNA modification methylase